MKKTIEPTLEYRNKVMSCTSVSMVLACKGFRAYTSMNQITAHLTVHTDDIKTLWEVTNELKPFKHLENRRRFDSYKTDDGSRFYTIDISY